MSWFHFFLMSVQASSGRKSAHLCPNGSKSLIVWVSRGSKTARHRSCMWRKLLWTLDLEKPKTRVMQYNATHALLSLFTDGARRLWPNFDTELRAVGGRLVYADIQLHYSGIAVPAPYGDYPGGRLPDTLAMRRSATQKALYALLMQHPTAAKITVWPGTLDGTQVVVSDIGLVVVSSELESRLPIPEFAFNSGRNTAARYVCCIALGSVPQPSPDYGSLACEPMAGETRDNGRFDRWFELKLISAATQTPQYEGVASVLWRVRNMVAADRALLAPTVLWKALWTRSLF
ncbi:hypothetical protein FB451DRAFT_1441895 [Mycena latifolia]|nr:hypothetical protein FB451DRAFT_1441895 [Mycena latifolia]